MILCIQPVTGSNDAPETWVRTANNTSHWKQETIRQLTCPVTGSNDAPETWVRTTNNTSHWKQETIRQLTCFTVKVLLEDTVEQFVALMQNCRMCIFVKLR